MRFGFFLPQIGPLAEPESVSRVALQAEAEGFAHVWVTDRLLWPLKPKAPYPAGDGSLPAVYKTSLDPLDVLAFVAARTDHIRLGTSILNLPWYNPTLLARRLTTIDVLSNGRLVIGFGSGWSPDEYEAAGTSWASRGKRYDEQLQVLTAIWTTDPVEFHGDTYEIARSYIGPKPVQQPHPPIYMAAYVPAAMARVARFAKGWHPVGVPLAAIGPMFDQIKAMAAEAGRDPSELELLMRANVELHEKPLGHGRDAFAGSVDEVAADIETANALDAAALIIDVTFDPRVRSVDDYLERLESVAQIGRNVTGSLSA